MDPITLKQAKKYTDEKIKSVDNNAAAEYAMQQGDYAKAEAGKVQPKLDEVESVLSSANQTIESMEQATLEANQSADYALEQGDYAKNQGSLVEGKLEEADQAISTATQSADNANEKAVVAQQKADLVDTKISEVDEALGGIEGAVTSAQQSAGYASEQGDYAKEQGDIAGARLEELEQVDAVQFHNRQDQFDAQLAQTMKEKIDRVTLDESYIKFYANQTLVYQVSVSEAGNSSAVQNYIDSLVSNGQIEGVRLGDRAVTPNNISFMEGVGRNHFDRVYRNFFINPTNQTVNSLDNPNIRTSIVAEIKGGKTYKMSTFGAHDRFILALADSFEHGTPVTVIHQSSTEGNANFEFTNTLNKRYLLAYISISSQKPPILVESIEPISISGKEIQEKIIDISTGNVFKNQFADGLSPVNITGDMLVANSNTEVAFVEVEENRNYKVVTKGAHNRFFVGLTNEVKVNSLMKNLIFKATSTGDEVLEFKNTDYKYCVIYVSNSKVRPAIEVIKKDKDFYIKEELLITRKLLDERFLNIETSGSTIYKAETRGENVPNVYTGVYNLYDSLKSEFPEFVKEKNSLGADALGNPIYEYVFKTDNYNTNRENASVDPVIKKNKVLITTSVHGYERGAVLSTYMFFKDLCTQLENERLNTLRESTEFRIIPIACPTGYNNDSRVNHNLVDLARNFPYNWTKITTPASNYSGETPASELETQVMVDWLDRHSDAMIYIDYHNTGAVERDVTYLAASAGEHERFIKDRYLKSVDKLTHHWRRSYGFPKNKNLGYTVNYDWIAGSQLYAHSIGIKSMSLESSWQQVSIGDIKYGNTTNLVAAEILGNLLLELCKEQVD